MAIPSRTIEARIGGSARDLELRLLDDVASRVGPEHFHHPILLVVPSKSLRDHVTWRLADAEPRSRVGLQCSTLHAIAADLVSRTGRVPPTEVDPSTLLARRLAARERPLASALGHLVDGYRAVLPSISDLLDAGLESAHVEGLTDALGEDGAKVAGRRKLAWAESLIRIAAASLEEMRRHGLGRTSTLMRDAAEVLWSPPEGFAPAQVWVYGFADATGVATDLLETLLKRFGGIFYLDDPPDLGLVPPEDGVDPPWGAMARFGRRFRERLLSLCPATGISTDSISQSASTWFDPTLAKLEPPKARFFRAHGREAEVREVARRVRRLLDSGLRPESIGLVARNLEPYGSQIRIQLPRLGIPFSGQGAKGPWAPAGRRLAALRDLLLSRERAGIERWLAALTPGPSPASVEGPGDDPCPRPISELRLALFSLGCGRLEDLANHEFRPQTLAHGLILRQPADPEAREASRIGSPSEPTGGSRRRIPGKDLLAARERARRLQQHFATWNQPRPLHEHRTFLLQMIRDHLGWDLAVSPGSAVTAVMQDATDGFPADFEIDLDELVLLLADALESKGRLDLGGKGGGIQVLDVIEARSRTFAHLFLLGLNRGTFPRVVNEDPLLPDSVRHALAREGAGPLPDLPRKLTGTDEERFLFSQCLSAADEITLSWLTVDDEGSQRTPSPLIERLRWTGRLRTEDDWEDPPLAPSIYSRSAAETAGTATDPRPAYEHAVLAAVHADRECLRPILSIAIAESQLSQPFYPEATSLAEARLRILAETDPDLSTSRGRSTRAGLGPYFGFVGPLSRFEEPRFERLWLTHLERAASCPWRFFLEQVLSLGPLPDPLGALPGVDPLLLGTLVHSVLDQIADPGVAREGTRAPDRSMTSLRDLRELAPVPSRWPNDDRFEALLIEKARETITEAGISVPGFERVLGEAARPFLEVARELDWPGDVGPNVLATELEASTRVTDGKGRERILEFRADRAALGPTGITLTDYKTAKNSISTAATEATRRKHLLKAVQAGARLQAAAYAHAAHDPGDRSDYLFLKTEDETSAAHLRVSMRADDPELRDRFEFAIRTILAARDRGVFFPRLLEPNKPASTPRACEWCSVAQACLQPDSGSRARLAAWARSGVEPDTAPAGELQNAFLDLWNLPSGTRP